MNLIDEKHIVGFERGEDACEVARLVEHRTRGNLESNTQFIGDDIAQRGLTQSRRTMQEGVVERFATIFRRLHKHFEVFHHARLSTEVRELQRSQRLLEFLFGRRHRFLSYVKIFVHSSIYLCAKLHICILKKEVFEGKTSN